MDPDRRQPPELFDPTVLAEFEDWAAGQMLFYDDLAAAVLADPPAVRVPDCACAS